MEKVASHLMQPSASELQTKGIGCGQVDDVICEGVPFDDDLYKERASILVSVGRGYFEGMPFHPSVILVLY